MVQRQKSTFSCIQGGFSSVYWFFTSRAFIYSSCNVRGSMTILKEFWIVESKSADVKTSYEYILELRKRMEETIKLAQEELKKNQFICKKNYEKNKEPIV